MILPSILPDSPVPIVLDASAAINFLGTGIAGKLLKHCGCHILMEVRTFKEVKRHPLPDRDSAQELKDLVGADVLQIVEMDEKAREVFYDLTASDLTGGLDDGEAATIALALIGSAHAVPVLDEQKAINLVRKKWPERATINTLDILFDNRVCRSLEEQIFADAIYSSLRFARMRVPKPYRDKIITLIGQDRARNCPCLGSIPF